MNFLKVSSHFSSVSGVKDGQISVPESPGLKAQGMKIKFYQNGSRSKPNGGLTKQNGHRKSQHRSQSIKHIPRPGSLNQTLP